MNEVRRALFGTLAADGELTGLLSTSTAIFHQQAPQDAATPYVVFARSSGTPGWAFAGDALEEEAWLVKAVDEGPSATVAEDIAVRVDRVLTDANLSVAGRDHLYLRRTATVDYPELDGADLYHHVGGMYRVVTA